MTSSHGKVAARDAALRRRVAALIAARDAGLDVNNGVGRSTVDTAHDLPATLPVTLAWDGTETRQNYLAMLAAANNLPVTVLQRHSSVVRAELSRLPDRDTAPTAHGTARRFPLRTATHPLIGTYDELNGAPTWVLNHVPDGHAISRSIQLTPWPWKRFDLLTDLAQIVMPRLSTEWPHLGPVAEHVLNDPTRTQPLEEWSLPIRVHALATLWSHTDHGHFADTSMQQRTSIARDLLTAGRWFNAVQDLRDGPCPLPQLAHALHRAAAQWPPAVRPTTPADPPLPLRTRPTTTRPGPFTVHTVGHAHLDTLHTLYAAAVALHALATDVATDCTGHPPAWARSSLEAAANSVGPTATQAMLQTARSRPVEPPPYAADACRLLATDAGMTVLTEVNRLASRTLLSPRDVAPAWATLVPPGRVQRALIGDARNLPRYVLRDVIWVDLTGHLPEVLFWPGFPVDLRTACQAMPGDNLLHLREWVSAHLSVPDLPDDLARRDHAYTREHGRPTGSGT